MLPKFSWRILSTSSGTVINFLKIIGGHIKIDKLLYPSLSVGTLTIIVWSLGSLQSMRVVFIMQELLSTLI
jgi:hypothetical protein